MKNGVPFDVAHAMDPAEALSWAIAFGENEGAKWSFDSMSWEAQA